MANELNNLISSLKVIEDHPELSKVLVQDPEGIFLSGLNYDGVRTKEDPEIDLEYGDVLVEDIELKKAVQSFALEVHGLLITSQGNTNYRNLRALEAKGFRHTVLERDSFGPLICRLTIPSKKFCIVYG